MFNYDGGGEGEAIYAAILLLSVRRRWSRGWVMAGGGRGLSVEERLTKTVQKLTPHP